MKGVRFVMLDDAWLDGKRAVVMGLGRFGGGAGAARFLVDRGCDVLVTDVADEGALGDGLEAIADLVDSGSVELRLGAHNVGDFTTCDVVVANPAVPRPWENRYLRAAQAAGIAVTTEIRLGLERLDPEGFGLSVGGGGGGRVVIGVTGTAGKSTVCAMMGHGLERLGVRGAVAGNIGRSVLDGGLVDAGVLVVEVSSAQLYWLGAGVGYAGARAWRAGTAVVTGFGPNHLDWHGGLGHYRESKVGLVRGAGARGGGVVLGPGVWDWRDAVDGGGCVEVEDAVSAERIGAGGRVCVGVGLADGVERAAALGRHNTMNACVAAMGLVSAGVSGGDGDCVGFGAAYDAVRGFGGLPHRLASVGVWADGGLGRVCVVDDSKCTTPGGVALAVAALVDDGVDASRVVLVLGGYDKGVSMDAMVEAGARCGGCVCIGTTGGAVAKGVRAAGGQAVEMGGVERVGAGVEALGVGGDGGGVWVVLSPGCASWDQFANYEVRGAAFASAVRGWLTGRGAVEKSLD